MCNVDHVDNSRYLILVPCQYMRSVDCSVVRTSLHNAWFLMWTIFFCMRLVVALAFHMLRASLAQTSAVLAL